MRKWAFSLKRPNTHKTMAKLSSHFKLQTHFLPAFSQPHHPSWVQLSHEWPARINLGVTCGTPKTDIYILYIIYIYIYIYIEREREREAAAEVVGLCKRFGFMVRNEMIARQRYSETKLFLFSFFFYFFSFGFVFIYLFLQKLDLFWLYLSPLSHFLCFAKLFSFIITLCTLHSALFTTIHQLPLGGTISNINFYFLQINYTIHFQLKQKHYPTSQLKHLYIPVIHYV